MIKRIILIILAILIVIAVVAVYLITRPEEPLTVPSGAQAGELVDVESCTYEDFSADCGTLVVPENRSNPESRLIALPVIRVHATSSEPLEPIFRLEGGPGISNMDFSSVDLVVENHDVVMVGYRGVDGSSVLDCPETVDALKSADDMLSESSLEKFSNSIAECAERLQDEGVDINGYTLLDRVEDMEAARVALGYDRINLLSESVGTRTAMIYAQAYPDVIYRSVMLGVNPPGHFLWKAEVIDEQLEYYAELCAQDSDCSARTDDLAETMREVSGDMPDHWLFMPINPGTVKLATFFGLFSTSTDPLSARYVIDAWLSAAEGDASGLATLSFAADQIFPSSFVWGETAATAASADLPVALEYLAEFDPTDSIIGTPGSTWMWGGVASWPGDLMPEEYRQIQPSDVETLIVSGTVDFSTPVQVGRDELLPFLTNGQQVVLSEFGHTDDVWNLQPEATGQLLTSFYETGVADDSGFTHESANFDVGIGFPEMIKIALTLIAIIIVLVFVLLSWFIYRRLRKPAKAVG